MAFGSEYDDNYVEYMGSFYSETYKGLGLFAVSPLVYNLRKLNESEELLPKILLSFGLPVTLVVSLAVTTPVALVCMAILTLASPVMFGSSAWCVPFQEALLPEDNDYRI